MTQETLTGGRMHRSPRTGTYHPAPGVDDVWTIHDSRGYIDGGPACDECGACNCEVCDDCSETICCEAIRKDGGYCDHGGRATGDNECVGLSFAFVCLDGGDALCPACAEKEGVKVVPCDCEAERP